MITGRNMSRFVSPVLEKFTLSSRRRNQIATMSTEARKDRQLLAANQDVDRIDLNDTHGVDRGS